MVAAVKYWFQLWGPLLQKYVFNYYILDISVWNLDLEVG
jgi:hypothetical protein